MEIFGLAAGARPLGAVGAMNLVGTEILCAIEGNQQVSAELPEGG